MGQSQPGFLFSRDPAMNNVKEKEESEGLSTAWAKHKGEEGTAGQGSEENT